MNTNIAPISKPNRATRRDAKTRTLLEAKDPAYPFTVRYAAIQKDLKSLLSSRPDIKDKVTESLRYLIWSWASLTNALCPQDVKEGLLRADDRVEPVEK